MIKKGCYFLALMFLYACPKPEKECQETTADPSQVCIQVYEPVCGCNKITYSNACIAQSRGIQDYTLGQCTD
ncbi:MAG: hypothetical protein ACPG8F_03105 [Flavobacteriaceae bacterium]